MKRRRPVILRDIINTLSIRWKKNAGRNCFCALQFLRLCQFSSRKTEGKSRGKCRQTECTSISNKDSQSVISTAFVRLCLALVRIEEQLDTYECNMGFLDDPTTVFSSSNEFIHA